MKNGKKRKKRDRVPNIRSLEEMTEYRRWAKKEKWSYTLSSWLLGPIACIVIGYLLIVMHFANIDSMQQIEGAITINGTYENIVYVDGRVSYYYITLCGSNERYAISVDEAFDRQLFYDTMQHGMPITLTVSLKNVPNGNVIVYAISSGDISFMSVEDTARHYEENNRYTLTIGASMMIIGFVAALIVAIVMYIRLRRIRKA